MPNGTVTPIALLQARQRIARASKLAALRESLGPAPAVEPLRPFASRRKPEEQRQRPAA